MKIVEFVQQSFRSRANKSGALVVYDPGFRLREIVRGMAAERWTVLDAGDSFIEAHERALEWWAKAGDPRRGDERLIIYVPAHPPGTPEQCCTDPFSGIAAGADRFPSGDEDSFQSLCERAKPEHKEKIRNLFSAGNPDLRTLEAVGGGNNWPQLQTLLGVESLTDIVQGLLAPSPEQHDRMKSDEAWISEAKEMLASQLGYEAKGRGKKWEIIADDLWRFLLFSEFAYDLPAPLPENLRSVPLARPGAETLVNRVCETLRQEKWCRVYIEKSERVAADLQLESRMRGVDDLGVLDTFAFEERSFLRRYVTRLLAGDLAAAEKIAGERKTSVWVRHTDRGLLWTVAERARELILAAEDAERNLSNASKSVDDLIEFYRARGYRVDQAQREMERAVIDVHYDTEGLEELIDYARVRHYRMTEKLQQHFVDAVAKSGWPVSTRIRATQVFDKIVAPLLETRGKRVAYFMVDALRYELAVALERQLATSHACRLQPVCAQLPTITPVGMAALLPKADGNLFLRREKDELVPMLGGRYVRTPTERMAYVREIYGDRARMMDLDAVIMLTASAKKKPPGLEAVELLIVKTTEIDEQGELDATTVCQGLPHILSRIVAAVGKLKRLGFQHAIFATDHGFVLHSDTAPGNTTAKPAGDWLQVKDRCLLGSGSSSPDTLLMAKEHAGVYGDFDSYVVPRSFATFSKRHPYFHEGLSLPEAVIPLLEVDLVDHSSDEKSALDVQLRYRGETSGVITTKRPLIDVAVFGGELFGGQLSIRLEARAKRDGNDTLVGEAASCPYVDPATGLVRLDAGQAVKVPMRIADEFSGAFEVRAVDAETGATYGSPLKLRAETIA